ncbi:hypothetical protein [[Eubacterium] cellulosolvens]
MSMAKTLFYIPRLYTPEEMKMILPKEPEDYKLKAEEFWQYIDEKLTPFVRKIKRVYHDIVHLSGREGLELISVIDSSCYPIAKKIVEAGGTVQATEDIALISEAESWVDMMRRGSNPGTLELFLQNLEERNKYIADIIQKTLNQDETGAVFIEPTRKLTFSPEINIIRVCPFEPTDYINSMIAKLKLEKKQD